MSTEELYRDLRARFPALADAADKDHRYRWGADFSAHMWFESLARVVNARMGSGKEPERTRELFAYLGNRVGRASGDERDCIDTAFVENLFWDVAPRCASEYWKALPVSLKGLYVAFHGKPPI